MRGDALPEVAPQFDGRDFAPAQPAGEVGDIGKGSYSFGHVVAYIAYTIPRRHYTMFPTSAVIGVLMGLVLGYVIIVALRDQGFDTYTLSLIHISEPTRPY